MEVPRVARAFCQNIGDVISGDQAMLLSVNRKPDGPGHALWDSSSGWFYLTGSAEIPRVACTFVKIYPIVRIR